MSAPPPTLRVFIAGISGSGKSTAAWRMYLSKFPRRILLDQTGEWAEPNPAMGYPGPDAVVFDVEELDAKLRELAPRGKWTISVELGLDDLAALTDYLIPVPDLDLSPIRAVRGAVLLVDEVDLIAPPRSLRQEVRTLWRRSRHVGLSIIATTQRPEAVSREVSAQSHHVLAFHLVEPRAVEYMASLMQADLRRLAQWTEQHPHGALWRELRTGRSLWLSESGKAHLEKAQAQPPGDGDGEASEPAGPSEVVIGHSQDRHRPESQDLGHGGPARRR